MSELDTCGCGTSDTEGTTDNAAGLSAIAYRVGTWATFRARMVAALPSASVGDGPNAGSAPLDGLTTREPDDASIALVDAFACVLDVLTFYQERIANEAFLRTATQPESVLWLAGAIGYQPDPGVAAGALLAFTVESAASAPGEATIPAGTQVMSIPAADGELPQLFETSTTFYAHKDWNTLPVRTESPYSFARAASLTGLEEGKALVVAGTGRRIQLGSRIALIHTVDGELPDEAMNSGSYETSLVDGVTEDVIQGWTVLTLRTALTPSAYSSDADGLHARLVVFRSLHGVFGYNAPAYIPSGNGAHPLKENNLSRPFRTDGALARVSISPNRVDLAEENQRIVAGSWCYARGLSAPVENPFLMYGAPIGAPTFEIEGQGSRTAQLYRVSDTESTIRSEFGLSAKVTTVVVSHGSDSTTTPGEFSDRRDLLLWLESEELPLAALPLAEALSGFELVLASPVTAGLTGRALLFVDGGASFSTTVISEHGTSEDGIVTLTLADELPLGAFYPASVKVYGNLVAATHGQTVAETLGSGDGSTGNQVFTLAQQPLTWVSAATARGAASTASIAVGGVTWTEASSFYKSASDARVYTLTRDADGATVVQFGDGLSGARLPTGSDNVTVTYRKGLGVDGNVRAGQLAMLKTRPFGVKAVTNPLAAAGGEDAEALEDARDNAPLTVLTLDRLVSTSDFEAFAAAFAGVAKARADVVVTGAGKVLYVSVLGAGGEPTGAVVQANLLAAFAAYGDPSVPVRVGDGRVTPVSVAATLVVDGAYSWDTVAATVTTTLQTAFAFDDREFCAPVSVAELIAAAHAVPGVVAFTVSEMTTGGLPVQVARAAPASASGLTFTGAELLVLSAPTLAE